MANITTALKDISTHRDVVPSYDVRSAGRWIVTGLSKTHGGAVIVDDRGQILQAVAFRRAALQAIDSE